MRGIRLLRPTAALVGALGLVTFQTTAGQAGRSVTAAGAATQIQHLVVIFQENVSFDHYFGT